MKKILLNLPLLVLHFNDCYHHLMIGQSLRNIVVGCAESFCSCQFTKKFAVATFRLLKY